jgi:hypothetical protein
VKNTSDRKRYLVPLLDPQFSDHLTLEITGPGGRKVRQSMEATRSIGPSSFEALAPGEVRRFEVPDLRESFSGFQPFQCSPVRKATPPEAGKYTINCRFKSPKVPERFAIGKRVVAGKSEAVHEKPSPELVAGQWTGPATAPPAAFELTALGKDDLVVHEWGVFTVFNDVKYANADRREEWDSLPSFFYRQFPYKRLRWVPSAWDKPIVYFYARPTPLRLSVQVTFPDGAPVVWWPAVADPVDDGGFRGRGEPRTTGLFRSLTWETWVGDRVPAIARRSMMGPLEKVEERALPADSWLRHARLPGASRLTVVGNTEEGAPKRFPGALDQPETERFLYYDGLVPAPDYLRCEKVGPGSVTLRNRAAFDLGRLFVVDRRAKGTVGFAVVSGSKRPFKAGTTLTIEPTVVPAGDWPAAASKEVRLALRDAGLFEAEVDSLLRIWQKRLLEAEGVTAFHVLPRAEYDRMLRLDVLPAPAVKPVRVGIALHPHLEIEPGLTARVTALIRDLDDDRFATREAASKELLEIGPLAINLLRAELKKGPQLEVRRRIEKVLERVDATVWLDLPAAGKK